ncbi:casein kinase I isoform alpha [Verticillium dahliae VdLs.17]|uniref:non-specific serine/threonine protein kinase n=1 Tax=Verticillium dahliae (strain VdLs.17 / ATCC MYA-4575 / FGSC 10137) TaxID=498257 RepID=G2X537_VERDV|nr:casein kinase I isoform alpha [Verticillium dahliae VdLs.17]EGY23831.1 casein kinase I isoform alpha [Verticillium dahliae VdLs.17]
MSLHRPTKKASSRALGPRGHLKNQNNSVLYKVGKKLGEGTFGIVYAAIDLSNHRLVAIKFISIAEALHGQGLIHRDIKPENFLIHGPGSKYPNKISLIDPAMAENYRCSKTERHIPPCEGMDLVGTARYMSINAHLRKQQSRRDDLESIFYVLFYLMRGGLPWQGLKAPTKEDRLDKILEIKQQRSADSLCGTQSTMFVKCLEYVRELGFEQDPDYDYLKCCLTKALEMNGEAEDDSCPKSGRIHYNAKAQATLNEISQFVGHSIRQLRRHQREVKRDLSVGKLGVTSHNNLNIGCDRLESALKSYDKLLRALEYVAVLSEKASWEFLRKASSDDVVGLKTELNGVESLVEDCLKLVEQTDNATISISRTSFATSQDSELPLEVDEIYAHPGDETHQQTSTTFESRGGKGSRNEESQRPDTTQDKSHAQKRGHTTLSPGPRPHKRPSYESLSSRADDRWPHGDGG